MSEEKDAKTGFTAVMKVGWRDRGMGRGDFGVIDDEGRLLAEVKGVHHPPEGGGFTLLPERENAHLFAGAPKLHEACSAAVARLKADPAHAELVAMLEAAIIAASPPAR